MTPNQLPPLPEPDGQMTVTFGLDEKRKVPVFFGDRLTAYALAAIAQQAQGVPDGVWEALQRLIENGGSMGPASQEDAILVAQYRDRVRFMTPPAPQVPAPVDELIEALEDLMDWQVKNVALWHNRAYDRAHRAIKKHRAAFQSPAPKTKGGEA